LVQAGIEREGLPVTAQFPPPAFPAGAISDPLVFMLLNTNAAPCGSRHREVA
jgi:hypothetical protein